MTEEKFIVATQNKDKICEIREILSDLPFQIITMEEAGFTEEIEETGETFAENAMIKAKAVHTVTGGYVMADDSGLAIDALDGAPGVYSARFHGKDSSYQEKIEALWKLLKDVPLEDRTAHFICAIAVVTPSGESFVVEGRIDGILYDRMIGENGFGYDPVFFVPEYGMTTAQMTSSEKHSISHRGRALKAMLARLEKM